VSRLVAVGRTAGAIGATLGLAVAGAAVGFAAERYVVGRSLRGDDPYAGEPLGTLRGDQHTVTSDDGVGLHIEVDEPAGRPKLTVIFNHGYALNLNSWYFQRRDLRGQARLVFWDQRSHGRSERSEDGEISFDRLARDLGTVLEEMAPKGPVVLVGHSMGGMTMMALASARPELFGDRVTGVGLVTTSHRDLATTPLGLPGSAGRVARRLAPGVVAALARQPDLIERGRRVGSDLGYVLTRRYSFAERAAPSLVAFTAEMNAATPVAVLADFLPLFSTHDQRVALPVLARVPTLVVGATGDRMTPVEHSRELAEALPNGDYLEIPEAGHMVLLERHEIVTESIRKLLQRAMTQRPGWFRRRWRDG
jgi:pimeloyl-ACP methyl ester carboxylesterase